MARMQVKVTGDAELMRKLARLGVKASDVLEAATQAAAKVIETEANGMAPGPNIRQETTEKAKSRVVVAVGPIKEKWYYRFHETGTKPHTIKGRPYLAFGGIVVGEVQHPGMAARPFLRPAIDAHGEEATEASGAVLRAAILSEAT